MEYFDGRDKEVLDVILHGSSKGFETSESVQKIFQTAKKLGRSVVMFNFPFIDRSEEHQEGQSREEEIETLKKALDVCEAGKYKKIRLIGKSLGGMVAADYLTALPKEKQVKYELVILGYIPGGTDVSKVTSKIVIYQGALDRYASVEEVRVMAEQSVSEDVQVYGVSGADHSFRDSMTKAAKPFDMILELLFINQKVEKEEPPGYLRKRRVDFEPITQKFKYDCGVATVGNLLLLLERKDVLETDLYRRLKPTPTEGTKIRNIKKLLNEEGIEHFEGSGCSMRDLELILWSGYVCMVCYQAWGKEKHYKKLDSGHYSIVYRVDENSVWFIDPSVRSEREPGEGVGIIRRSKESFNRKWKDKGSDGVIYNHWLLAARLP
ncbi:MAG: hypothetical protein UX47_C0011G0004 [Candidatus Collierbacteria bacterium GW2011_GWA2_46_26]|uniref:Uncharacterized protein n=1 Tax=Candidatus Collierbacteria bacterium GW2011_GWA2_46_26 TaxID=1618381 RepID=A0A0G1RR48_9BACT|nr:MAG: hypothetical protein UW29_C0012G0004 [Candidatus Collierbacteria bacterium GW2011_GWC2_44_13]KKU32443.1 MAG: hypothetical protein UX47_C0011G0004 [Candidatus Collierbacteria bacterium GW2011_GWA2_46_26]